jgi:hypothetical protein
MLVDVRVILLVGDDKTIYIPIELETLGAFMYMMGTNASTKRWTLTLPKFDEPFDTRFYFENFWGNRCWSM